MRSPLRGRLRARKYARFMDDWVVLPPTRWKLRWAARLMQQTLAELKARTHPAKTFLGRTSRGFDFLCYRFGAGGRTGVAEATKERFVAKATRLAMQDGTASAEPGGSEIFGRVAALAATLARAVKSAATKRDEEALAGATAAAHEPRAPGDDARSLADEREPRLYEQALQPNSTSPWRHEGLGGRCGAYVRRWCDWVRSGLSESLGNGLQPDGIASTTRPRRGRRCPAAPA
jgi:hypothetical protein